MFVNFMLVCLREPLDYDDESIVLLAYKCCMVK